jgi:DNA-binding NarL/FixJ family response regulator
MLVSESTIKTYLSRLYDKLGVNNRAQALAVATRAGLLTGVPVSAQTAPTL